MKGSLVRFYKLDSIYKILREVISMEKVLIIGGGPAGYTAAIYAARANLSPLLIAGPLPGGQLMLTSDVENFPGFKDPVVGPDLMEAMRLQAERVGTKYVYAIVTKV